MGVNFYYLVFFILLTLKYGMLSTVSRLDSDIKLFQHPETFTVESTVVLSELGKELGIKVKAILNLKPIWRDTQNDYLLKFNLLSPQQLSKSKSHEYLPQKSLWDSYPDTEFYVHWKNGIIAEAYMSPSEPIDVLNLKKSILSLFQFHIFEGESSETDVSGVCKVQYEAVSLHNIKKIKNKCVWNDQELDKDIASSRVTLYKLGEALNNIKDIYSKEEHSLKDESLRARAWLHLHHETSSGENLPLVDGSLADALQKIPSTHQLMPLSMQLPTEDKEKKLNAKELTALLESATEALASEAGEGGTVDAAACAIRVLPALSAASRDTLAAVLTDTHTDLLPVVCRLLGLTGTAAAHRAAERVLQLLRGDPAVALSHHYLEGLALAPEPEESVVTEVLQIGDETPHKDIAESALLAAATAATRLPSLSHAPRNVRDALVRSLARCKDDECRAVRLLALGNMRRSDVTHILLEHAERPSPAALAALDALACVPALDAPRLARLEGVALASRSLEIRAAALDLLLQRTEPKSLVALLSSLNETAPSELRRLMWQRLNLLAEEDPRWATLLGELPLHLRGWSHRAAAGTSALLVREAGRSGDWRARLQSVQLTRAGLLRRARVTLNTMTAGVNDDTLAVELWARGLQSLAGDADEADADEAVSGGLAFTVGGARTRSLTMFESQGELLGHVWAGTGSEPTAVLRALRPLNPVRATLPLPGAVLKLTRLAAVAIAMDAQAQVSLWSRNARTALTLRGAAVSETRAEFALGGRTVRVASVRAAEPRLHIAADIDFYSTTAMCVRVSTDPYEVMHNATLASKVGRSERRVRVAARVAGVARTLSLGALNDLTCATMGAL
ncbi:microsomal triglyceride transfer protein large subunit [Aricia agestis]|uniref:microsomal triglyceride transfer protein large subunit n=1 Tax=Aricia agestis TaxID=91739 RepID=UPI001C201D9C|nr:microsomal triglyceride transfer protein large subunit [Aricia agestis]